jgi:CheY-like chemotaxis protein
MELREAIVRVLSTKDRAASVPLVTRYSLNNNNDLAKGMHILLVEDNAVNQKLAVRLLEKRGHHVTIASNGREALTALEMKSFDLVLMDVQMPIMDGLEATALLREKEKKTGRHQQVIAMTALVMKGDRERCIAAGMDGYLTKPIRTKELDYVLEKHAVNSSPSQDEPATIVEAGESAVNTAELMERIGEDRELLAELIGIFQKEYPGYLQSAREALALGKIEELKRTAHTLRGSLSNLAADSASQIAGTLENEASSMTSTSANQLIDSLAREISQVVVSLNTLNQEAPH